MKRNFRIAHSKDFLHIKNDGESKRHKLVVLAYVQNDLGYSRMACVSSKAIGNAVKRNLIKRRMKACVANSWSNIKSGWDMVFYARSAGAHASYDGWLEAINEILHQADLLMQ